MASETIGFIAAIIAALSFGSYGVPMKGEAATKVDVDPLVFQSYKAFTVFLTSTILILVNNVLAPDEYHENYSSTIDSPSSSSLMVQKWNLSDFTNWAFVSAFMWVPGGTAGVYAIRRAGLAVSVGLWSCVIVILSYMWGVLIFGERQLSRAGGVGAMSVLCLGFVGLAYFSSSERDGEDNGATSVPVEAENLSSGDYGEKRRRDAEEGSILLPKNEEEAALDFGTFPRGGAPSQSHETLQIKLPFHLPFTTTTSSDGNHTTIQIYRYHLGLLMAILNGVLAATIMVPLHYAPPHTTQGVGYSMSFGIAAVVTVIIFWILRWGYNFVHILCSKEKYPIGRVKEIDNESTISTVTGAAAQAYDQLPSFHISIMWKPGFLAGMLYSMGNLFGIISIQNLGDFMGYSLNQTSLLISGLWGIFYYKEIPGVWNIVGFFASACVVFIGILWMGHEHVG